MTEDPLLSIRKKGVPCTDAERRPYVTMTSTSACSIAEKTGARAACSPPTIANVPRIWADWTHSPTFCTGATRRCPKKVEAPPRKSGSASSAASKRPASVWWTTRRRMPRALRFSKKRALMSIFKRRPAIITTATSALRAKAASIGWPISKRAPMEIPGFKLICNVRERADDER